MTAPSQGQGGPAPERAESKTVAPDAKASRDAAYWAKNISRLTVREAPAEAINLNVTGRRVTSPIQGFGKMWQKIYRARLPGTGVSPEKIIEGWKENFPAFWPEGNRFYGPLTGIAPGETALLNLSMPGGVKLSTGVLVLYADDDSFTFMTPEGHMFSGWITFSAFEEGGDPVAEARILMRASDPLMELGLAMGGHRKEDEFWQATLRSVAAHFGAPYAEVTKEIVCVDRRRQWSRAKNVWQSSAIRSGMYAPVALVSRPFRQRRH